MVNSRHIFKSNYQAILQNNKHLKRKSLSPWSDGFVKTLISNNSILGFGIFTCKFIFNAQSICLYVDRCAQCSDLFITLNQGLYSLSSKTSYRESREVSKPRDWILWWLHRSEIRQVPRLRGAGQILMRLAKSKPKSRSFETSRDLVGRCLTA